MNISFKEAFTYFLKDKIWKSKSAIFTVFIIYISSLPAILPESNSIFHHAVFVILNILFSGYLAFLAHNLINKKEEIFPGFNFKKLLPVGFKSLIVSILYGIPAGILTYCGILILLSTQNIVKDFAQIITIIFMGVLPAMLTMCAITAFAEKLRLKDSFNLIRLTRIFMYAYREYYILCLFIITYLTTIIVFAKGNMNLDALFLVAIGGFLAIAFLLYFIAYVFYKKKFEFAQEFLLFALCITFTVAHVAPITILQLHHQHVVLILCLILFIIKIPLALIEIHLLCQVYEFGANRIKELNLE